jgi:hypothetical protein
LVERFRAFVEITNVQALLNSLVVHLDAQNRSLGHAAGKRLCPTHSAKARCQDESPAQRAAEMALSDPHEDLVGALDDALRPDILPIAGGQAAPANEILLLQRVEVLRFGPLSDHVAVRHDHDRRFSMGFDAANRLSRLHDQRLMLIHRRQRFDDHVVRRPIARGAPKSGIDHEVVGILADR